MPLTSVPRRTRFFASPDWHPSAAGEFVWTGWDYLGEPTPYYEARSSYSGIIDLAGFTKDRFYLNQSRWRPDLPMEHIDIKLEIQPAFHAL
jgi:beta-galactosidase